MPINGGDAILLVMGVSNRELSVTGKFPAKHALIPGGIALIVAIKVGESSYDATDRTIHDSVAPASHDDVTPPSMDIAPIDELLATSWPWLHEELFIQDTISFYAHLGKNLLNTDELTPSSINPVLSSINNNIYHLTQSRQLSRFEKETVEAARLSQKQAALFHRSNGSLGQSTPLEPEYPKNNTSTLSARLELVNELVTHALKPDTEFSSSQSHRGYWRASSLKLFEVFSWTEFAVPDHNVPILYKFVDLFTEYFHPLWPLLPSYSFDPDVLHPILYLTLTSIGAMYGDTIYHQYGAMMHESIRKHIIAPPANHNLNEDSLWLGQSRVLTQVAALYFGQKMAFSHAQRLGGILVSQGRRMKLFNHSKTKFMLAHSRETSNRGTPGEILSRVIVLEARKRLAFAILRAEVYTSFLLNTRPLVSADEIDIELPCSDDIWTGEEEDGDTLLKVFQQDDTPGRNLLFSDIVRDAMDQNDTPLLLGPTGQELTLFGLQDWIN
ncbi:hypothetical protein B7463_g11388, partial [Scytalidium lignicola]